MCETNSFSFQQLADRWDSDVIARDQHHLDRFSGGLLNARTLANADAKGTGPSCKFKMGNKVFYTVSSLIEWMDKKLVMGEGSHE